MAMKVLVQNGDTGLFLKADNLWTKNPLEARDFCSSTPAIQAAIDSHLDHAALVLSFGDSALDLTLPLGPLSPRREPPTHTENQVEFRSSKGQHYLSLLSSR